MIRESLVPPECDELLNEWARYFKDRHRYNRAKSIEGMFNPYAPGAWDTGWGDPGAPEYIKPDVKVPRVLLTHAAIQELPKSQKWSVTFGYCYPNLERWMVLKSLKKYCGRRFTWSGFLDELDIGRVRVWARINSRY